MKNKDDLISVLLHVTALFINSCVQFVDHKKSFHVTEKASFELLVMNCHVVLTALVATLLGYEFRYETCQLQLHFCF